MGPHPLLALINQKKNHVCHDLCLFVSFIL